MGDRVIHFTRLFGTDASRPNYAACGILLGMVERNVRRTDLRLHTTCPDCISILDSPPDRSDPARVEAWLTS